MIVDKLIMVDLKALFIGAHPDDIEIAAGGTVAKLTDTGWEVWFCILTCESDHKTAKERKKETIASGVELGVNSKNIIFLDLPDTNLKCSGKAVEKLRSALKGCGLDPDIVFSHSQADSHNDHRAAYEICNAAFRKKIILNYGVVNSLISSNFQPKLFVDISKYFDQKTASLEKHTSQLTLGRIFKTEIEKLSKRYSFSGLDKVESFEIIIQERADDKVHLLHNLNDEPFHKFWYSVIGNRDLKVIHSVPVYRRKKEWDWPTDKDREGVSLLQRMFSDLWQGKNPIEDHSCKTEGVEQLISKYDVLLSGGAVSNKVVRTYFNHFKGLRYFIPHIQP